MSDAPTPTIFCEYGRIELPKVLSELELLMKGLLPGGVLRLSTEQPDAVDAVPTWCRATGNRIIGRDVILNKMLVGPCVVEYFFDIERGDVNVYSASLS